jgi:hypothetical protein
MFPSSGRDTFRGENCQKNVEKIDETVEKRKRKNNNEDN